MLLLYIFWDLRYIALLLASLMLASLSLVANYTSFLTSEKRMYYWIATVADVLWTKGDNTFDINWRDRKEPNESISQTELIVSEKSKNVTDNEKMLYQVVFYLITGKIMIQGKAWESFCDKHFNKCLQLVNDQ